RRPRSEVDRLLGEPRDPREPVPELATGLAVGEVGEHHISGLMVEIQLLEGRACLVRGHRLTLASDRGRNGRRRFTQELRSPPLFRSRNRKTSPRRHRLEGRMRKRLLITLGATVALVAAATAYAAFTAAGIAGTSGTFATGTASDVKTRQCTGGDGKAFTITDAKFAGTVSVGSPAIPELSGPATFRIKTTADDASHLGVVEGSFKVKDDDTEFHGRFVGTLDGSGKFSGFLTGDAHKGSKANVAGTLSGTFVANTGFGAPAPSLDPAS